MHDLIALLDNWWGGGGAHYLLVVSRLLKLGYTKQKKCGVLM